MKTIIITGASRGIGLACAKMLEKKGFFVFAGVRTPADAKMLRDLGYSNLMPLILDVTKESTIQAAYDTVVSVVGKQELYGLVNNAGILVSAPVECVNLTMLRQQLEVNVVGQIAVTQTFLPLIRPARGRIVMISSIAGLLAFPFMGTYCASKFALEALSDALRMELSPWHVSVSLIEPPYINTNIWNTAIQQFQNHDLGVNAGLYADALKRQQQQAQQEVQVATSPEIVVKAIIHALTAKYPKARYPIGYNAKLAKITSWLPTRLRDWIICKRLGLTFNCN